MNGRHQLVESPQLGRGVHLWTYGWFGWPVLVFPSAAGFAHEWQAQGMIDALTPLMRAGKIKLYCPESNVAEAWTRKESDPAWRIGRHNLYERFIVETLVPFIRDDCRTPDIPVAVTGCSLGGMYAALAALKYPELFNYALCMSGRYDVRNVNGGFDGPEVYFNNPLAFVPNLQGAALDRVRRSTFLALVCGQGAYEEGCIEETVWLGQQLAAKQIPHVTDIWGKESRHDWGWWKRQVVQHLVRRFGST
ncbi:MAG TPA: alpha/beta hydrolase-fold protein [Myxococcota bacterium]|nr:alpha/beta hydrolase-fold protein [Myxococcota bacterium]